VRLNIAHKIFGIALVVLVLMAAVAVFSVRFTAEISRELDLVAGRQLPLSDTIGQINVRILEEGLLLQRLFAIRHESVKAATRAKVLRDEINGDFAKAYELLSEEAASKHPPGTIRALQRSLKEVERDYRAYEQKGEALLALHEKGDESTFAQLLPDFNELQFAVDKEISVLRRHVETVADDAVKRADKNEKLLLYANAAMTTLAALLGLGIAAIVTSALVRNIRALVRATDAVGDGNLDTQVPVVTRDEVGRLATAFNAMVGDLRMKERIKDTFGKYMDPRIVTRLIENPEMTQLGGERKEMTVMFIDLQGYTTIAEKLPAAGLVQLLNMFLTHMTEAVSQNKGVINDFLGDAVMAYWGPPFTEPDEHATLACRTALAAFDNFERYKAEVAQELGTQVGGLEIAMRIGISTGNVISGNIGSSATRKFSVVGDPANLGARLEGANKTYGTRIMLSQRTRELVGPEMAVRELDLIKVKGKTQPTRIYELRAAPMDTDRFMEGLAAYRAQDWNRAAGAFTACRQARPDDPVPGVFLDRIAMLRDTPPGPDWDGVWEFQTK
jgi:adenylate cyclase